MVRDRGRWKQRSTHGRGSHRRRGSHSQERNNAHQNGSFDGYSRRRNNRHRGRNNRRGSRRNLEESPSTSSAGSSSQSTNNDVEIPGFYYDPEKKKYFKILPNQNATISNAVTKESIGRKLAEEARKKHIEEFTLYSNIMEEIFNPCVPRTPSNNVIDALRLRSLGDINNHTFRSRVSDSCFKKVKFRGKCKLYKGIERLETMHHMCPNSTGEYFACMWTLERSFAELVQPIRIENIKCINEKRDVDIKVKPVGSAAKHAFSRVQDICWASRDVNKQQNEYLLYTTMCYRGGSAPSLIKLRNVFPENVRDHNGQEFNLGLRATWSCAWNPQRQRIAIGTEKCALVMDLTRRLWEMNTSKSDAISETFTKDGNTLFSGTRSGIIFGHDLRSISTRPIFSFGKSHPISHLEQTSNSNYICSSDFSGKLRKWDLRKHKAVLSYEGHEKLFSKIRFHISEEDDLLYSAGSDNYVRLWSLESAKLLLTIPPMYPAALDTVPTVHYSSRLAGNYPGLIIGTRDELHFYSI